MHICSLLLMPDSLSLVWDDLVHFAKFAILRFSKRHSFNSFHRISSKLYTKWSEEILGRIGFQNLCHNVTSLKTIESKCKVQPPFTRRQHKYANQYSTANQIKVCHQFSKNRMRSVKWGICKEAHKETKKLACQGAASSSVLWLWKLTVNCIYL